MSGEARRRRWIPWSRSHGLVSPAGAAAGHGTQVLCESSQCQRRSHPSGPIILSFAFRSFFRQGFLYSRLDSNSSSSSCLSLECWSCNREAPGSGSYSLKATTTPTFYFVGLSAHVCRGMCGAENSFWGAFLFFLVVLGDQIEAFRFGGSWLYPLSHPACPSYSLLDAL